MAEFLIRTLCNAPPPRATASNALRLFRARQTHPVLAPYATPAAIAARLKENDHDDIGRRSILRALVELYRADPCDLWASLIVRAYEDLLLGIRAEVRLGLLQHDDIDQQIVMLLLRLIRDYDLDRVGDCLAYTLGRDLRRDLYRALHAERREVRWLVPELVTPDDESDRLAGQERMEARALLSSITEGHDPAQIGEHLLLCGDESFHAHIVEVTPGTDEEREREYQRARRALVRWTQRAREIIDADPDQEPTARIRSYLEARQRAKRGRDPSS